MTTDCGPDPAFAASPSSQSSLSRPSGLQSGVGARVGILSDAPFVHAEHTNSASTKMLVRLVRAATNVAGAETDAPNFDAFLFELQQSVAPFEGMIALPPVGTVVQYFNPAYSPGDNQHAGRGPYAAIVTRAWEYADSRMCNLSVVTPGKDALAEVRSVPERGSQADDGKYPCWEVIQ